MGERVLDVGAGGQAVGEPAGNVDRGGRGDQPLIDHPRDGRRLHDRARFVGRREAPGARRVAVDRVEVVGVDRGVVGVRHDVAVADPHHHGGSPLRAGRLRLRGEGLLREPLQVGIDGQRDGAAVGSRLGHDGAPRQQDAIGTGLVGRRTVGACEAGVLLQLGAGQRAVRADEAHQIAGDGAVRVGARRVRLAVHPRDVERLHLVEHAQLHGFHQVDEVRRRVLGQRGVERLRIGSGQAGDLADGVGEADLGLRAVLVGSVESVGRNVPGGRGDVEAVDAVGEHDAVAVHDVAARTVGGDRLHPVHIGQLGELGRLHQLDVDQADHEHRDDREHGDHGQRQTPFRHAQGDHGVGPRARVSGWWGTEGVRGSGGPARFLPSPCRSGPGKPRSSLWWSLWSSWWRYRWGSG